MFPVASFCGFPLSSTHKLWRPGIKVILNFSEQNNLFMSTAQLFPANFALPRISRSPPKKKGVEKSHMSAQECRVLERPRMYAQCAH